MHWALQVGSGVNIAYPFCIVNPKWIAAIEAERIELSRSGESPLNFQGLAGASAAHHHPVCRMRYGMGMQRRLTAAAIAVAVGFGATIGAASAQTLEFRGGLPVKLQLVEVVTWSEAEAGHKQFMAYCAPGGFAIALFDRDIAVALNGYTAGYRDMAFVRTAAGNVARIKASDWSELRGAGLAGASADVTRANAALAKGLTAARRKPGCD